MSNLYGRIDSPRVAAQQETIFVTQQEDAGIAEQVINKAAEFGISSQLADAESIDIDIDSEPLKLVQGEVDSVTLKGEGIVTPQNLRLEELELQTGNISIDLLSAVLGKIELNHAADALVRVVVTTADINRALNSDYLRNQLQQLAIPVNRQAMTIDLQRVECNLPSKNKLVLKAEFVATLAGKVYPADFRGVLGISPDRQYFSLLQGQFLEGKDLPLELTVALLTKISELLSRRRFQDENLSLHLKQFEVEPDLLTLCIKAFVKQVPS